MEHGRTGAQHVPTDRFARVTPQASRPIARDPKQKHVVETAPEPIVSPVNQKRGTFRVVRTVRAPAAAVIPERFLRHAAAQRQPRVDRLMPEPVHRCIDRVFRRHRVHLVVLLRR